MLILTADEMRQLGKHVLGAATFVSNFVLWGESGYFDEAAETKPLLHLWSLGIEEQFYVFWPLLIWAAYRLRLSFFVVIAVLGTVSFVLNVVLVQQDNVAAFYSPLTRAWELSLGGLLACFAANWPTQSLDAHIRKRFDLSLAGYRGISLPRLNDGLCFAGAILIALGLAFTTNGRTYPGLQALLPTIGAALLILAGSKSILNRFVLARPELVWIGLISYPLYLWHWPLLTFARIAEGETPSLYLRMAAVAISFALAALTYWLIERPIRFGAFRSAKTLSLVGLMVAVGLVGFGLQNQFPIRGGAFAKVVNQGDIGHDEFHGYLNDHFFRCTPPLLQKEALVWQQTVRCFQSHRGDLKQVAIIGDSHAEHLFIGFAEALPTKNVVYYIKNARLEFDSPQFKNIFRVVISDKDIRTVILAGYWHARWASRHTAFESDIDKIVSALVAANKTVYFVEDVPSFSFDAAKCKYRRIGYQNAICAEDRTVSLSDRGWVLSAFASMQNRHGNVSLLKTSPYLCDDTNCTMARDGLILYRDGQHLNIPGSRLVGKKIVEDNPRIAD